MARGRPSSRQRSIASVLQEKSQRGYDVAAHIVMSQLGVKSQSIVIPITKNYWEFRSSIRFQIEKSQFFPSRLIDAIISDLCWKEEASGGFITGSETVSANVGDWWCDMKVKFHHKNNTLHLSLGEIDG